MSKNSSEDAAELTNRDIFLYALYRMDGAGRFVDIEEIVEECWRLSPTRFGWRSKKYPSDRRGWAAAWAVEKGRLELQMKTPNGLGRQLTAEGVDWVRQHLSEFHRLAAEETRAPRRSGASFKLLTELVKHPWAIAFLEGEPRQLSKVEAADLITCAPDSSHAVWRQRISTLRSAAADHERTDIVGLLDEIERGHPDWFSEE